MAARRAALGPDDDYTPSDAEKEADAAALKSLGGKGGVEVSLDDDDDDDEEPPERQGPSRQEKKQQRKRILDENADLREREARARETAAQALGYAQALQQRQGAPQAPQADPWEEERKALQAEQDLLVREFELKKANLTSADADDFKRRAWAFEEKKAAYHARRTQPQGQQNPGTNPEVLLMARYPDIMSDERVKAWAFSRYNQRLVEGKPNDWSTRDEVVEETREFFKLGQQRRQRDDREPVMRRKLAGMPKGGSGGGGDQPSRIQLTKDQVKEADVAYPHLPEEKRYKHYARLLTRSG